MRAEPKKGDIVQFTKQIHVWQGKSNTTQTRVPTEVMNEDVCLVVNITDSGHNVPGLNARWIEMLWNGQIIHASSNAYGDSFQTVIPIGETNES